MGSPTTDTYIGSPHYVVAVSKDDGTSFNIVVEFRVHRTGPNGDNRVYAYVDPNFVDPICDKLRGLQPGLHTSGFPKLDYWQDRSLLDIGRMRPVPYKDATGGRFDINDQINDLLAIDESTPSEQLPLQQRPSNTGSNVLAPVRSGGRHGLAYTGFLFPAQDGLHETHIKSGQSVGRRPRTRERRLPGRCSHCAESGWVRRNFHSVSNSVAANRRTWISRFGRQAFAPVYRSVMRLRLLGQK